MRTPSLKFGRTWSHLRHYRHILAVLMKYGFEEVVDQMRGRLRRRVGARAVPSRVRRDARERSRPARVRLVLEELGPTFIKLGQLLSTRPDLIPPEYVEELERLQDQVGPVRSARIRREVERELRAPLDTHFREFNDEPIAAGSIAQVHKAILRDGQVVAVKVRRPGIVRVIETECEILENLAHLWKSTMTDQDDTVDPVRIVEEFTSAVGKEVDLGQELQSQKTFSRNFDGNESIRIPKVYESLCTDGVLVMEYISGVKPTHPEAIVAAGGQPRDIAIIGADFILQQIFDHGFFHTDPHPGNLLVVDGRVLVPLDFGQVARLTHTDRELLAEVLLAIVNQDPDRLVRAFRSADLLDERTNQRDLSDELEEMLEVYYRLPVNEIPFGKMMSQTFDLIRRHYVRPPAEFTLMMKSMMTIECLAKALHSDFQLIEHLKPYARRITLQQYDPRRLMHKAGQTLRDFSDLAEKLPHDVDAVLTKLRRGQVQMRVHHEHLEDLVNTLGRSSNRISFAMIIAALLIGSSLLVTQESGMVLGLVTYQTLGILGYLTAAVIGLWLLWSIYRSRHL